MKNVLSMLSLMVRVINKVSDLHDGIVNAYTVLPVALYLYILVCGFLYVSDERRMRCGFFGMEGGDSKQN